MKWGRQRRQQQQQQQKQEQGEHPSSAFSLLRVFPLSWVSKLKPTRSKPDPPPQPPTTLPNSKPKPNQPELRPRPPPPRLLSPERHLRRSSASDHLSFSPAVLDRLVGRAHEAPEEAPRRHSCAGDNDDTSFFISRSKARRPFESARFHGARTEEPARFRALSCRSCRADLERPHGRLLSGNPELSSETGYSSSDEDDPWRRHIGREEPEAAPPRRRHIGQAPPPPKDNVFARMKPVHEVPPTMKCNWRSSGREEKAHRRCTSAAEPVAQDQHVGGRRSFSLKQRSRVKVYSPRAAAARAAAKERGARKKVAEEEERRERGRRLESLAVVKWSVEPEEDFRESMVEMIRQRGMGRPEDMEGLLACYLALNADEYHDVIVKVFRQVWLEVRPTRRRGVASPREEQGEAAASAAFELSSGL